MLSPVLKYGFEKCRRALSPSARSDLDRLAEKLKFSKTSIDSGGDYLTSFTKAIVLTAPALSSEECTALAFYALCSLCAASAGTNPLESSSGSDTSGQLMQPTKNRYLLLQKNMDHENRMYTAVSNIMKIKHDTVKNSISNIR